MLFKRKNAINLEIENHSNKIIFFAIKFVSEYIYIFVNGNSLYLISTNNFINEKKLKTFQLIRQLRM